MKHNMSPPIARRSPRATPGQQSPRSWRRFADRYPIAAAAYDTLSDACCHSGPLDEQSVALAKLAVSVGGNIDRTVHMHAKKALRAGVPPDALVQVALIAMPTIGLARALDALRWIDEIILEAHGEGSLHDATD